MIERKLELKAPLDSPISSDDEELWALALEINPLTKSLYVQHGQIAWVDGPAEHKLTSQAAPAERAENSVVKGEATVDAAEDHPLV